MSDHIHYWHGGGALTYHIVHPDGSYERKVAALSALAAAARTLY